MIVQILLLVLVNFKPTQCDTTGMTTLFSSASLVTNTMTSDHSNATNNPSTASTMVTNSPTSLPSSTQPVTSMPPTSSSPSGTSAAQSATSMVTTNFSPSGTSAAQSATSVMTANSSPSGTSAAQPATSMVTANSSPSGTSAAQSATSMMTANSSPSATSSMSHASSIATINSSTGGTTMAQTSNTPATTQASSMTYMLSYSFNVESEVLLMPGSITDQSTLNSVQQMVNSAFDLTALTITVLRAQVQRRARSFPYVLYTDSQFQTTRANCPESCVRNAALSSLPTQGLTLLSISNSPASVSVTTSAQYYQGSPTTQPPVNSQPGESPPGVAAQLGMGLGISFLGILLIAEVVFFSRKYRFRGSERQAQYEMPSYNRRESANEQGFGHSSN